MRLNLSKIHSNLFSLLLTKASIEEEFYGCEQSIITCKEALILWKNEFEPILMNNIQHVRGISHSRLVLFFFFENKSNI